MKRQKICGRKVLAVILSAAMAVPAVGTGAITAKAETSDNTADSSVYREFYVSVDGNDETGDGTAEKPFATVEAARDAVREINADMNGDIIVNLRAGDYYLDDTIVLTEKDSGTNGHEVIYRSVDGVGAANLIGGERITGWELADEDDVTEYDLDESLLGKVYKVQLDPEQYEFNTLYVNDARAVMARTRNRDNNPNFPMASGEYMRSTGGSNNNYDMYFNLSDLDDRSLQGMIHAQERGEEEIAQVFVWDGGDWDWFTNTLPVISINGNHLQFPSDPENPLEYYTRYNIGSGARFFLQGNLAFMDVEGEYHYNKSTGVLYYYPKQEDGPMEEQTVIVPTMQKVLYLKGADKENPADEPDPDKQVHNITIDGLGIKDTEFARYFTYSIGEAPSSMFPAEAMESTNPTYCTAVDRPEFRVGSVTLDGTHDITITNTRVKNTGMYGIIYAGDNQYNTLSGSVIENTGYGGLIFEGGYPGIGKYNNHNTVNDVLIHNTGELVGHAVGFTVMSSGQNTFTNMEIFNTPKRAVLVLGGYAYYNGVDKDYDPITDMYTVGNHFKYIHVHDAQQDAGEDSAVFLSWLLAGKDIKRLHGSNDPNNLTTNLEGIDTSIDRYNYFEQMLITDVGADPSVIEKCTVGGLDTAMGASGSQFKNIKAANTQHHLLAIRDRDGGGYGDMYGMENCTNNLYSDEYLETFDDDAMEYDKIGLTDAFPEEYRVYKRTYREAPDDLYFYDDFEESRELNTKKWMVEKGELQMFVGYGYMSENPTVGKRSLPINADLNKSGIVVSHKFENRLNKIVEVQYMDRRKDYANSDRGDAVPTEILPNSFLRVDDGETALGLGAVGSLSKDYYVIKKGDELILTDVKRCFGWHTFKFDYSSGEDVKLYIDDELVADYTAEDGVSTFFGYIGMGDWEGKGGKAFFDQLYVYGGQDAPPEGDLPELYTIPGTLEAENYAKMSGVETEECEEAQNGRVISGIETGDWIEYNLKNNKSGIFDVTWTVNVPEGQTAAFEVLANNETVSGAEISSTDGTWQKVTTRMEIQDGLLRMKLVSGSAGWKLDCVTFDYLGSEVPGRVEAENFSSQSGTQVIDVDGGGQGVGYIEDGDWMEYPVVVAEPGRYALNYCLSVNGAESVIELFVDGQSKAVTSVSSTGGWQNWKTFSDVVEFAEAGVHTVRLNANKGLFNIDWFEISDENVPPVEDAGYAPGRIEAELAKGEGLVTAECADGGQMLTGLKAGDTFELEVYSARDQKFTFDVRCFAAENTALSLCVNGAEKQSASFAASSGWATVEQAYPELGLQAGKNILTFTVESGQIDLNYLYAKTCTQVYGRVEAEDGDFSEGTSQPQTDTADGGTILGFAKPGQIYKYKFDAPADGDYTILYRAAVYYTGQTIGCRVNGELQSQIDLPGIKTWDTYQTINGGRITLREGENEIALLLGGAGPWVWNFNWFEIVEYTETGDSDTTELESLVSETRELISSYRPCEAYYALKAVLLEAADVLEAPQSQTQVDRMTEELGAAKEKFLTAVAEGSAQEPEDVRKNISVRQPEITDTALKFENVPDFYSVSILTSEPAGYVSKNGYLILPDKDTTVTLQVKVTRLLDGKTAEGPVSVVLPGLSAENVAASLKLDMPGEKAEKISLPSVPSGFEVFVKESTEDRIAADGTITYPMEDMDVEVVFTVRKPITGAEADASFTISLKGVGKSYGVPIEPNDIDAMNGTHIKVQNNEVYNFNPGDWIQYNFVDFGEKDRISSVYIETAIAPSHEGKTIQIVLDDLNNTPVGSLVVKAFGNDWGIYGTQEAVLTVPVSGYHTVYLVGVAGGEIPNEAVAGIKTVTVDRPSSMHSVVIDAESMENGTVTADKEEAMPGENVILTVTPDEGWELAGDGLKVNDGSVEVSAVNGTYSFAMPEEDVTVRAEFVKSEDPEEPENPEEPEEPADQASKVLLQKTYEYALTLGTDGVVDSAVKAFEQAKADAKAVLDNADATQAEVDSAWDRLLDTIWGLGLYKGDKTNLELLIAKAQNMMENRDKYVTANWQQLVDALAEAEKVDADGDAMDEDITPAADDLLTAILVQRYKANKANLQSLVEKANAIDLSGYMEASVAVLRAALAGAEAVLADDTLSTDDQKTVDDAAKELEDAINALEGTGDGDNKDDGDNTGDTGNKDDSNTGDSGNAGNNGSISSGNNSGSTGSNSSTSGKTNATSPKTGDNANVIIWICVVVLALALCVVAVVVRQKRKK